MEGALLMMRNGDEGDSMEYVEEEAQIRKKGQWFWFWWSSVNNFKSKEYLEKFTASQKIETQTASNFAV